MDDAANSPVQDSISFAKSCKQAAFDRRQASRTKWNLSPGDEFSEALNLFRM